MFLLSWDLQGWHYSTIPFRPVPPDPLEPLICASILRPPWREATGTLWFCDTAGSCFPSEGSSAAEKG